MDLLDHALDPMMFADSSTNQETSIGVPSMGLPPAVVPIFQQLDKIAESTRDDSRDPSFSLFGFPLAPPNGGGGGGGATTTRTPTSSGSNHNTIPFAEVHKTILQCAKEWATSIEAFEASQNLPMTFTLTAFEALSCWWIGFAATFRGPAAVSSDESTATHLISSCDFKAVLSFHVSLLQPYSRLGTNGTYSGSLMGTLRVPQRHGVALDFTPFARWLMEAAIDDPETLYLYLLFECDMSKDFVNSGMSAAKGQFFDAFASHSVKLPPLCELLHHAAAQHPQEENSVHANEEDNTNDASSIASTPPGELTRPASEGSQRQIVETAAARGIAMHSRDNRWLLWWARCKILCAILAPQQPPRQGRTVLSQSAWFRGVVDTEKQITQLLRPYHSNEMTTGTIADVMFLFSKCSEQSERLSAHLQQVVVPRLQTANSPWNQVMNVAMENAMFLRSTHQTFGTFLPYSLLLQSLTCMPINGRGRQSFVAQQMELLRSVPQLAPESILRTVASNTLPVRGGHRHLVISPEGRGHPPLATALDEGFMDSCAEVLRYHMVNLEPQLQAEKQRLESAGELYSTGTVSLASCKLSTNFLNRATSSLQLLVQVLEVLRHVTSTSVHHSVNPVTFLLKPREGHFELCQQLTTWLREYHDLLPIVCSSIAVFLSVCIHHNVRDVVPALLERNLLDVAMSLCVMPTVSDDRCRIVPPILRMSLIPLLQAFYVHSQCRAVIAVAAPLLALASAVSENLLVPEEAVEYVSSPVAPRVGPDFILFCGKEFFSLLKALPTNIASELYESLTGSIRRMTAAISAVPKEEKPAVDSLRGASSRVLRFFEALPTWGGSNHRGFFLDPFNRHPNGEGNTTAPEELRSLQRAGFSTTVRSLLREIIGHPNVFPLDRVMPLIQRMAPDEVPMATKPLLDALDLLHREIQEDRDALGDSDALLLIQVLGCVRFLGDRASLRVETISQFRDQCLTCLGDIYGKVVQYFQLPSPAANSGDVCNTLPAASDRVAEFMREYLNATQLPVSDGNGAGSPIERARLRHHMLLMGDPRGGQGAVPRQSDDSGRQALEKVMVDFKKLVTTELARDRVAGFLDESEEGTSAFRTAMQGLLVRLVGVVGAAVGQGNLTTAWFASINQSLGPLESFLNGLSPLSTSIAPSVVRKIMTTFVGNIFKILTVGTGRFRDTQNTRFVTIANALVMYFRVVVPSLGVSIPLLRDVLTIANALKSEIFSAPPNPTGTSSQSSSEQAALLEIMSQGYSQLQASTALLHASDSADVDGALAFLETMPPEQLVALSGVDMDMPPSATSRGATSPTALEVLRAHVLGWTMDLIAEAQTCQEWSKAPDDADVIVKLLNQIVFAAWGRNHYIGPAVSHIMQRLHGNYGKHSTLLRIFVTCITQQKTGTLRKAIAVCTKLPHFVCDQIAAVTSQLRVHYANGALISTTGPLEATLHHSLAFMTALTCGKFSTGISAEERICEHFSRGFCWNGPECTSAHLDNPLTYNPNGHLDMLEREVVLTVTKEFCNEVATFLPETPHRRILVSDSNELRVSPPMFPPPFGQCLLDAGHAAASAEIACEVVATLVLKRVEPPPQRAYNSAVEGVILWLAQLQSATSFGMEQRLRVLRVPDLIRISSNLRPTSKGIAAIPFVVRSYLEDMEMSRHIAHRMCSKIFNQLISEAKECDWIAFPAQPEMLKAVEQRYRSTITTADYLFGAPGGGENGQLDAAEAAVNRGGSPLESAKSPKLADESTDLASTYFVTMKEVIRDLCPVADRFLVAMNQVSRYHLVPVTTSSSRSGGALWVAPCSPRKFSAAHKQKLFVKMKSTLCELIDLLGTGAITQEVLGSILNAIGVLGVTPSVVFSKCLPQGIDAPPPTDEVSIFGKLLFLTPPDKYPAFLGHIASRNPSDVVGECIGLIEKGMLEKRLGHIALGLQSLDAALHHSHQAKTRCGELLLNAPRNIQVLSKLIEQSHVTITEAAASKSLLRILNQLMALPSSSSSTLLHGLGKMDAGVSADEEPQLADFAVCDGGAQAVTSMIAPGNEASEEGSEEGDEEDDEDSDSSDEVDDNESESSDVDEPQQNFEVVLGTNLLDGETDGGHARLLIRGRGLHSEEIIREVFSRVRRPGDLQELLDPANRLLRLSGAIGQSSGNARNADEIASVMWATTFNNAVNVTSDGRQHPSVARFSPRTPRHDALEWPGFPGGFPRSMEGYDVPPEHHHTMDFAAPSYRTPSGSRFHLPGHSSDRVVIPPPPREASQPRQQEGLLLPEAGGAAAPSVAAVPNIDQLIVDLFNQQASPGPPPTAEAPTVPSNLASNLDELTRLLHQADAPPPAVGLEAALQQSGFVAPPLTFQRQSIFAVAPSEQLPAEPQQPLEPLEQVDADEDFPWTGVVDPEMLLELPPDVRSDVLREALPILVVDYVHNTASGQRTRVHPAFLSRLSDEIRSEVLALESVMLPLPSESSAAPTANQTTTVSETLMLLAMVTEPELRRDILMSCSLEDLASDPAVRAEAEELRRQAAERTRRQERERAERAERERERERERDRQRAEMEQRIRSERHMQRHFVHPEDDEGNSRRRERDREMQRRIARSRRALPPPPVLSPLVPPLKFPLGVLLRLLRFTWLGPEVINPLANVLSSACTHHSNAYCVVQAIVNEMTAPLSEEAARLIVTQRSLMQDSLVAVQAGDPAPMSLLEPFFYLLSTLFKKSHFAVTSMYTMPSDASHVASSREAVTSDEEAKDNAALFSEPSGEDAAYLEKNHPLCRLVELVARNADSMELQDLLASHVFKPVVESLRDMSSKVIEDDDRQLGLSPPPPDESVLVHKRHHHPLRWTDTREKAPQLFGGRMSQLQHCVLCRIVIEAMAYQCTVCPKFVICPSCALYSNRTVAEQRVKIDRWAYWTLCRSDLLTSSIKLMSQRHCKEIVADYLANCLGRGLHPCGNEQCPDDGPLCQVEALLCDLADEMSGYISKALRQAHKREDELRQDPNVKDLVGKVLLEMELPETAMKQTHNLFLPFGESQRPQPSQITKMWHAIEIYLTHVSSLLALHPNKLRAALPTAVYPLINGFAQYHLKRCAPDGGSQNVSQSFLDRTETERLLSEHNAAPSAVSDAAVTAVIASASSDPRNRAEAPAALQHGNLERLPHFVSKFCEANRATINALIHWEPTLLDHSFKFLTRAPRLIELDFKMRNFRKGLQKLRRTVGSTHLTVRRARCFEDSYKALKDVAGPQTLHIKFDDEGGVDAGGLTREWFQVMGEQMVNNDFALFLHSSEGNTYQPNPLSSVNPSHLEYFRFCGVVVGLAVYSDIPLDIHFTRSVYRHMIGVEPVFRDVESIDPEVFQNLQKLIAMDIKADMDIDFSVTVERFGQTETVELCPEGRDILLTNENKKEYIRLRSALLMTGQIEAQLREFLIGFYRIVPRKEIQCFTEQELELVISGMPDIDVEDLRVHTEYQGYNERSPIIRWFWEIVAGMTKADRANLLMFATGSSKVPHGGFANLETNGSRARFSIAKMEGRTELLPLAHTCFNRIDLPDYPSSDMLREKLTIAITHGCKGFDFS